MVGAWALGCGGSSEDGTGLPPITAGMVDELFPNTGAESIEFELVTPVGVEDAGGELRLVAGQTARLRVQVQPPGRHTVRFALLGQAQDAFLTENVVDTQPQGSADTLLTVLAASSSFAVRAAAGRASRMLRVVTLEASQASLVVTPNYDGQRTVTGWVASVHLDQSCAALQGVPFPDGLLASESLGDVRIDDIPADTPLAVVIRAGQFAGGCRSIASLRANTDTFIEVDVMERPMQTAGLSMALSFGVEETSMPNPALDELAFRAVRPLAGGANDDLAALLDAMSAAASDAAAFEQARTAQAWRVALLNGLAPDLPGSGLRTLVQNWMRTGLSRLQRTDAFRGTLTSLSPDGMAALELSSVIGLSPAATGFERENTASAVAETEDFLRVGATLSWRPSPLLAAAANLAALLQDPDRSTAADAMATQFGCDDVASILVEVGSVPGVAFDGCDEACALGLCRAAMLELWSRVEGSDLPAVAWQISGAARAQIDENARPTRVDGNWVGSLNVVDFGLTPIQGPFSGQSSD